MYPLIFLDQWFSTFSEPWLGHVFLNFAWPIALWTTAFGPLLCCPPPRKKGLHSVVSVVCLVIALISKKKVFTSGRAIFALISDNSASECPIFVNSAIEIPSISFHFIANCLVSAQIFLKQLCPKL